MTSPITSKFLLRNIDNCSKCSKCPVRYLCGGGCAATSFNVYGDINAFQDFMCSSHKNNYLNHLRHVELEEEEFI